MRPSVLFRIAATQFHLRNMHNSCPRKAFTVFVEGNIGSGKTTFLNHFHESNALILSEPVDIWRNVCGHNLLGSLYEDPSRWGLLFQSYVQLTMLDLHLRESTHPVKLLERSIHSARKCFVENLHRSQTIKDAELVVLDHWYQWITSHMNVGGDLIVYLKTTPEIVYERIKARAREEERCVPLDYLTKLHELHEEWLIHKQEAPAPVVVLDANRTLPEMEEECLKIKAQILSHKKQAARGAS